MAQAGYRVRIRQPDPEEIEGLATMIAPFVDLDVERLEEALREGPAVVGDGLDRREAEQLARLFTRLGAQTDLVEPDQAVAARPLEEPRAPTVRPAEEPDFIRQTQPFDARALREALMERGGRLPTGEESLPPPEEAPEPETRSPTQPFSARALRQAMAAAIVQKGATPVSALLAPFDDLGPEDSAERLVSAEPEGIPPRARLRGRPRSGGPDALPGGLGPPSLPPPLGQEGLPPLDPEAMLRSGEAFAVDGQPASLVDRLTPPGLVPSDGPLPAPAAPRSVAPAPRRPSAPTPPVEPAPEVVAAASRPPLARPVSSAPASAAPPPGIGPVRVPRPRAVAPITRPGLEAVPPPRPSGGHSQPDLVRAAAIRERTTDARGPWIRHRPGHALALGLALPGMGQLYNGQRNRAIAFALAGLLIVPWIWAAVDAYRVARAIVDRRHPAPDRAARRAALSGQVVLDAAVYVALAGAVFVWHHRSHRADAPPTAAPPTAAPPTLPPAPVTAAPATLPLAERPLHELLSEGRNRCGDGDFATCERIMLLVIDRDPNNREAHRLLVDARTQRRMRERQTPPVAP